MKSFITAAFNPMNFVYSLKYMLAGMIGILIIIALIMVITVLLNYFTGKKKVSGDKKD